MTAILAVQKSGAAEREPAWTALNGAPGPDDKPGHIVTYEYDSAARLPVERVRLRFHEKNTLAKTRGRKK